MLQTSHLIYMIKYLFISMEAVGTQVIVALSIPFIALTAIIAYYWTHIREYIRLQMSDEVRIEENEEERARRERQANDAVCSICLGQPKDSPISSTCGHSFCADCIFSLYQRQHSRIKCPLCRQEMNVLFKLFQHSEETQGIQKKLRDYNIRFDDNRSIMRRITELPYVLQRIRKFVFSAQFIIFFLRSVHIIRMFFFVLFYLLLPFDLIPQSVAGVIGYIDDILLGILIILIFISIAALQFMRRSE